MIGRFFGPYLIVLYQWQNVVETTHVKFKDLFDSIPPYPWWTQGQSICSSKCQNKDVITLKCWKQILIALEKLKLWGFLMMLKSASCVCSGLNLFISFYLYKIFKGFSTWLIQLQFLSAQAIFLCSIWCCPRSTNFADIFN